MPRLVDYVSRLAQLREVESLRLHRRWRRIDGADLERATALVSTLLPDDASRVEEELVWLRLAVARPRWRWPVSTWLTSSLSSARWSTG